MTNIISQANILIVDDTPFNIDILVDNLNELYDLQVAVNGQDALDAVEELKPDLILLDVIMPDMDGFEVCRRLKSDSATRDIPIVFLTAMTDIAQKSEGFELGAVDYITKPFDTVEVKLRVETHLSNKFAKELLSDQNATLENLVRKRTKEIQDTQDVTIRMAASLAETRDNETGIHIIRTQRYVKALAEKMMSMPDFKSVLNPETVELLVKSAPLHDIGKIGVPDKILLKPGKLEPEEFEEMKKHTTYGDLALKQAEMQLEGESFLKLSREIAVSHHEKWDGSGYPSGLKGDAIPLSGRIMAIADVYDALICKRVYKPPFPHSKAVSILTKDAGSHFDPNLSAIFIEIQEDFRQIALALAETAEEREALNN